MSLWEYALTSCFGVPALHQRKKEVEGQCSKQLTLWGIDVDTEAGTFALPPAKVDRAREFLVAPEFGPGNTRIPRKLLQELMGGNGAMGPMQHSNPP